jgi:hypothetical protein
LLFNNNNNNNIDIYILIDIITMIGGIVFDVYEDEDIKEGGPYSTSRYCIINRIPAMAPILAPILGVHFSGEHISLKNWTFCPLFIHDSSSFKDTCFLTK